MKIAGFVPLSLCDYPGHIAAVVFTQGCNFKCPFCHNGHLIPVSASCENLLDEDALVYLIKERRSRLHGVVLTGGEPILQKDLAGFLLKIKSTGLKTKLDTNGASPQILAALLKEKLVDFVAMDIKAPWHKYKLLAGVECDVAALRKSVELIASSGIEHQFRTTQYHEMLNEADYAEIKNQVPESSPHVWQEYRPPAVQREQG
ncbi:MAG: anaerobic ribonucleoside-triphosphate reductase activating protein [Kiritimatiellia bacterium]